MSSEPLQPDVDEEVMHDLRRQADATPALVAGEEAALLEQAAHGNRESQSRLLASRLEMVIRLAEARRDSGLSVSDLVQDGSLGLVEAIQTFAGAGEHDFAAFAERKT